MQYKGPLPRRLTRGVNSVVTGLRSAPLSRQLLSRRVTVVTYTGRRSGRIVSTPVGYQRTGDTVTIAVGLPERKTWWRNFTGAGGTVALHLDGADRTGHAVAQIDDRGQVTITVHLDN